MLYFFLYLTSTFSFEKTPASAVLLSSKYVNIKPVTGMLLLSSGFVIAVPLLQVLEEDDGRKDEIAELFHAVTAILCPISDNI